MGCVRRLRHCENSSDKFPINQYKMNTRNIGMKRYKLLYDYFFNWKLTALQCCGILYHTVKLISHQLSSKTQSIKSVKPVTLLILCCPLFLPYSIFPSTGSLPMNQFFASGGQSIGVSASASVFPTNIQD